MCVWGGYKYTYENVFYTEILNKSGKWAKRRMQNINAKCRNRNAPNQYIYGFPCQFGAWCNSKLKVAALNEAKKNIVSRPVLQNPQEGESIGIDNRIPDDTQLTRGSVVQLRTEGSGDQKFYRTIEGEVVQYIGIAADEGQRTERHIEKVKKGLEQLPLVDANWTEQMCMDWCRENKLLSPIYEKTTRGGCWFCYNQGVDSLRQLRHDYPDLWALLLKWDGDSPVTFKADGRTVHDFEKRFRWEDEGYKPTETRFRWSDVDNPQMNIEQYLSMLDEKGEGDE